MVEIFKTNVQCPEEAGRILQKLTAHFPAYKINFDLTDCDNILRVEGDNVLPCMVTELLGIENYDCLVLE